MQTPHVQKNKNKTRLIFFLRKGTCANLLADVFIFLGYT